MKEIKIKTVTARFTEPEWFTAKKAACLVISYEDKTHGQTVMSETEKKQYVSNMRWIVSILRGKKILHDTSTRAEILDVIRIIAAM